MPKTKKLTQPLKWHGGKSYLAKDIIKLMPQHMTYVEPYAGGAAVLLRKDPEGVSEVLNDIHPGLAAFWEVMSNAVAFEEFYRLVCSKPFSEAEWDLADQVYKSGMFRLTTIQLAAMFFIRCRQSMSGRGDKFAARTKNRLRRKRNEQASAWQSCLKGLPEVCERMQRVIVLDREAVEVMDEYDAESTVFYLDPPYMPSTRASPGTYEHDWDEKKHMELLAFIKKLSGMVLLSGYPSDLYTEELADWHEHEFKVPNNVSREAKKRIMTEVVWTNF